MLDEDAEPTEDDVHRVQQIVEEQQRFGETLHKSL